MQQPTYLKHGQLPSTGVLVTHIFKKPRIFLGDKVEAYTGPPLRINAHFQSTKAASKFLGYRTNVIGKAFRKNGQRDAIIKRGVVFLTAEGVWAARRRYEIFIEAKEANREATFRF